MTTAIGSLDLNAFSNLYSDSNQYFWFESDATVTYGAGVHVTLVPDTTFISNPTGQNILINTDGFSVRNGLLPMMTLDNDSLDFNAVNTSLGTYTTMATFGLTGATIGQTSGAHSIIDTNGQRFYASDGTTQLANIGYGEGQAEFGTAVAPYYTFGIRDSNLSVGNFSVAEGVSDATGYASHAEGASTATRMSAHSEGEGTIASGIASHSEGNDTTSSGKHAHAEGQGTIASGYNSHAQNMGTVAQRKSQTSIGEYNIADTQGASGTVRGSYAFIIGNGTADNARSNALTVDWSGDVCLALDTTAASGTDHDLYAAITALGWQSDVIV